MAENYIQLEQTKYSNPFNYTIKRSERISQTILMVPLLIFKTFVDNSILDGFTDSLILRKELIS